MTDKTVTVIITYLGEARVNIAALYEIASNDQNLASLGLAIEEAKMERSLMRSRLRSSRPPPPELYAEKLENLEREISYLEARITAAQASSNNV